MSFYFEINGIGSEPIQRPLVNETHLVGSSNRCDLQFNHPELEAHALQVDIRGDDVWLQNLNPYSIYVGDEEVANNAWASWELSETVQLTRSISVRLVEQALKAEAGGNVDREESGNGKKGGVDTSQIIQIIVAGVCFLIAPLILFSGGGESATVEKSNFNFQDTIEILETHSSGREIEVVRDHLQRAWMADQRWSRSHKSLVVNRYRQLVKLRLMRATDLTIGDTDSAIARQQIKKEGFSDAVVGALIEIKKLAQLRLENLDKQ